jgi:pimeloyl-ACP methyl ester carboxylesterase
MACAASRLGLLLALLASCRSPASVEADAAPADRSPLLPDGPAAEGRADRSPSSEAPGRLPCSKPPCAERPILFIHGFVGSNDDYFWLLDQLAQSDPRFEGYQLAGREDHASWTAGSIARRSWLFAFDYYIKVRTDARGSYTAGPGRIGSNATHACTDPAGPGFLVADSADYDKGTTHDYAADLADLVESVRRATGAELVDVVAHSMGGMILRSYLSYHGGAARVKRVLLLASPVAGVPQAGLYALVPFGHPSWMDKHEISELDGGSLISQVRFTGCGELAPQKAGAWGGKLLDYELANPPKVELHVMSGSKDLFISYDVSNHPLAVDHLVVDADHSGILKHADTLKRVKDLLGSL